MTRLGAALALAEWTDVVRLGGPAGDVEVDHVETVADVRAEVPASATGGLVAVAGRTDRDDWRLDVLLRRAAAAGASAVLVQGDAPLGRASSEVARRLALPVLGAPDPVTAAVALRVNLSLPELAAARWVTAAAEAVTSAGPGVEPLVRAVAGRWGRPVWLLDSAGNVVAGEDEPDLPIDAQESVGGWLRRSSAAHGTWVAIEVATDHPRGAYLVVRRADGDPARAVVAGLEVLGASLAGRLSQLRLSAERDARQRMSVLSELLQSGGQLPPEAPRRMLDLGWRLAGHHVGVRIDLPSDHDPVALRAEAMQAFHGCSVDAQVVEHGDGWAAWTTFDDPPGPGQLQAHSAALRRVQWLLRSSMPSVMGVGSVQQGPDGLARTLGEGTDAARIAATRAAGGYLVHVDRLGLSQLLLAWTRSDTFAPAASSLLTPIRDQPLLLETLAAYLDAESSVGETAAVLGVHRNTVTARIARATGLLGITLDDPDERLAVQLACRSVLSQR